MEIKLFIDLEKLFFFKDARGEFSKLWISFCGKTLDFTIWEYYFGVRFDLRKRFRCKDRFEEMGFCEEYVPSLGIQDMKLFVVIHFEF